MLDISNYYEQLVIDRLTLLSQQSDEPLSKTFLEDVACLALNRLPPSYVRHRIDKGARINDADYEAMMSDVAKAIDDAIIQVHKHPHDQRDEG